MPTDGGQTDGRMADGGQQNVVVVIVTHEGPGNRLDNCTNAVSTAGGITHIVVVDNSGRPDTHRPTASGGTTPVTHLRTENNGYGAAFNTACRESAVAAAEFVALLNDDVVVSSSWLAPLLAAFAEGTVGAAQPALLLADTQPVAVNSLGVEFDKYGAAADIGFGTPADAVDDATRDITMFTGGAVLFRRSFLDDLGGFDERYFLYYEDVDLSLRGAERGWTYRCVPTSVVTHTCGATTDQIGDLRASLQERNRLVATFRFGDGRTVARGLWLSIRRLRHAPRAAHGKGLVSGVARMPRALAERRRATRSRASNGPHT